MADGFCSEMAPRSRNGQRGNWTCTVAPWVGGSRAAPSGSRNTTRWLIVEGEGRWKMNCVSETAWMLVWTVRVWLAGEGGGEGEGGGLPARPAHIAPNMVVLVVGLGVGCWMLAGSVSLVGLARTDHVPCE